MPDFPLNLPAPSFTHLTATKGPARVEATNLISLQTLDVLSQLNVLNQARSGDRAAVARLLNSLADPWYRVCFAMLGDADVAREATQECAARLLAQWADSQRFRGDSSFKTFAIGIAINVSREFRRSRGRMRLVADVENLQDVEEAVGESAGESAGNSAGHCAVRRPEMELELAEERARMRQLLDELPERQREAIVLRFYEELSIEETAVAMKCAPGTIKATVFAALRAMKEKMQTRRKYKHEGTRRITKSH